MDFNQLIAMFLPATIATTLYLTKVKNIETKPILIYSNFVLFINLLNYIIIYYIFGKNYLTFTAIFTIKYIVLSIFNTFILLITSMIIKEYIRIDFVIKKKDKHNEK